MRATLLHLVRHASTPNNLVRPQRLQGHHEDVGLSPEGRIEAEQARELLAGRSLAAIYSSPLLRARETAECIAAPHALPVQVVEALIEVDVGRWERKQWDEIERTDREAYEAFMTDPAEHGYPEGENLTQVLARVAPAFRELMAAHPGEEIAAVTHNVVNRAYLADLLGVPTARWRDVPQDNGGVSLVRMRDGKIRPLTINGVLHLSPP